MQVPKVRVRELPAYWGKWFRCVSDSTMKQADLNIFYQFGKQLETIRKNCQRNSLLIDAYMYCHANRGWLVGFLGQTKEVSLHLKRSRARVETILSMVDAICDSPKVHTVGALVAPEESDAIFWAYDSFEECFAEESRKLQVFMVTPKGTRHTEILIENPESDLPENAVPSLPPQFLYDLKQAARCLAFDIPTACAFHIFRGTESLMLAYHEALTKKPWPLPKNRDWGAYITQLERAGALSNITGRLNEIRDKDRNPYIHPEKNVEIQEAKVFYDLCAGVNYYMAEEIAKLNP